jgi:chromosome segregation ATPase
VSDTTKPGDPADKAADGAFGGVTSHRAGYGDKLTRVEDWVRRHPSATLASGEGAVLLAEIDRLRKDSHDAREELGKLLAQKLALRKELENLRGEVLVKHSDWELEHAEVVKLRAAIERVHALQAPDRETVEAALEAEWAHGRAEPDATRRSSARAALIGVARHLRERLGL